MAEPTTTPKFIHPMRVSKLSEALPTTFDITPSEADYLDIAKQLDAVSVKKMRFVGDVEYVGKDWVLSGTLGATVTQSCVVTLEPVRTRIDIDVRRRFTAQIPEESQNETTIPEDEEIESLGDTIDPAQVAVEAIALELPEYPRIKGATIEGANFGPPGVEPLTDEALKPFAGLEALKKKLEGGE